jgi:hypothetical protein
MSRTVFFSLLIVFFAVGELKAFDYSEQFTLKKDQIAKVEVIKRDYETHKMALLKFRWTLYHNDRLVLLVNYDGFPTQHVLKKEYKKDSIRLNLLGDYVNIANRVYLILKFSNFDSSKKLANFDVMIKDPKKRVEVKFIHPKR